MQNCFISIKVTVFSQIQEGNFVSKILSLGCDAVHYHIYLLMFRKKLVAVILHPKLYTVLMVSGSEYTNFHNYIFDNFLYFVDRVSRYKFLVITNLTHFSCIYLFHVSTCFERHSAHHQEIELY